MSGAGFGQAIGASVSGVVTDESGASIPGATVTITNNANGTVQVLVSGDQGKCRLRAEVDRTDAHHVSRL
jgi:hypothetical protein